MFLTESGWLQALGTLVGDGRVTSLALTRKFQADR